MHDFPRCSPEQMPIICSYAPVTQSYQSLLLLLLLLQ